MRLVLGSRGSQLALWQAHHIAGRLQELGCETHIEIIKTTGDHLQTASLVQAGGKGLFTKEIEDALLAGSIDVAVHSLKDLPTESPEGLTIAAIPEREDPCDAAVGCRIEELAKGARVGTSSNRRRAQLLLMRPDLLVEPVRGNVDTRLRKLREGQFSALLLAAAGLRRLGWEHQIAQTLTPAEMCPAPGQGALGIQTRVSGDAVNLCVRLNHLPTSTAVDAERSLLSALGGGCQLPVGAFARLEDGELHLLAGVFAPDGSAAVRSSRQGPRTEAIHLGQQMAEELIRKGARELLSQAVSAL